jgi:predicted flap endonuclease-1-like 5' DNA nuclease
VRWLRRISGTGAEREKAAMAYKIHAIDGIDDRTKCKLEKIGIRNSDDLLRRCASRAGRAVVAAETGIDEAVLLKWVHVADLMRIAGIGAEYAELLEAVGVETMSELRQRCAPSLAERMRRVNADRRLTRAVPSTTRVARWIDQAKTLPTLIGG